MGVKYTSTLLENISQDLELRNDYKYYSFVNKYNWNLFKNNNCTLVRMKDILTPCYKNFIFEIDKGYRGIPTGKDYIDEDGDIISYLDITKDNHPDRLKYSITNENILISSLKGAKSPAMQFSEDMSSYVFSNGFYIFKVNKNWNQKFILYILKSKKLRNILDNNLYRGIGISSYKERDLLNIKIPKVELSIQNKIISDIEKIENKIKDLKRQYTNPIKIINDILNQKFKLNINKLYELQKEKYNTLTLSDFANNKDMRNSCKFHCKSAQYAYNELKSRFRTKIKDYISEPIVLGASVSPSDYDENGKYRYLSMASIKTWQYDNDSAQIVSDNYANDNPKKVKKDDIIIARSGEGTIGKVALIQEDIDAIFCDFTMRLHLKNYNPAFAYYYFRTEFFQELIYGYKKGLGNNTNIFPIQIQEFPIPDIDLAEQQEIVDEIQSRIDEQNKIRSNIQKLRDSINDIIENALK